MEENLKNSFRKAIYQPDEYLANKLWNKMVMREKNINRFKLISFSFLGIASVAGLIPIFKMLTSDFIQSGFYEYFSFAFSRDGLFSSYWKEFAFSLAESLPVASTLFSLSLIFIFLLSLRFIIKQITQSRLSGQLSF